VTAEETFGELLRWHRHAAGLTLEELAAASGVSARAISDMERGRSRGPQRRTVQAIADVLELSAADHEGLLAAANAGRSRPTAAAPGACELPRAVGDFTGRAAELGWLRGLVAPATATPSDPATVVTVSGGPGLGKTTLAVRAAGLLAERFPDGQFFVDLRGMDPEPLATGEALTQLLRAYGTVDRHIPQDEQERAGLYRSLLRRRRSLLVLDNAADEAQVRPLLPAGGPTLTLVTSRRPLAGLEGVHRLVLPSMPAGEAAELLQAIVGAGYRKAEPGQVDEVARLCGNLPLALRIAGNRLLSRPGWTVGHLAGRLTDSERRLDTLTAGDLQVRAAFALSYQHLSALARRAFRRLVLAPGPDTGVPLAAVLAQCSLDDAEAALDELVDLGLLQSVFSGRYHFHDLIRLYARAKLTEEEPAADRQTSGQRMIRWLLDTAVVAGRWFEPGYGPPPPGWSGLVPLATAAEARAWLQAENLNWFAALRAAAADGQHAKVLEVADAMHWFSDRWTHWRHWHEVYALSRAAAQALGDGRQEAVHLNYLAWALTMCEGRHHESIDRSREALRFAGEAGDVDQQGWAWFYTAIAQTKLRDLEPAAHSARAAVDLLEAAGDRDGYPQALAQLGVCLRLLGHPADALDHHRRLLAVLHDPAYAPAPVIADMSIAYTHLRLGDDYAALHRWQEAADHYQTALPGVRQFGRPQGEGRTLHSLARALRALDDIDGARASLRQAIEVYLSIGDDDLADESRRDLASLTGAR
jgi:transcriptional regulator with XRE-family HTH domain/tetratricopeptide (TPR) repeat protein